MAKYEEKNPNFFLLFAKEMAIWSVFFLMKKCLRTQGIE